ncbi:MAG: hypothetical protein H6Q28_1307 [Bacteroidetes bacterium]|nr:hypothetical protein [Bacteroidota bacterium]
MTRRIRVFASALIAVTMSVPGAFGQLKPDLLIFDEDDAVGAGYYDASFGRRTVPSTLTLGGPSADKLRIVQGQAATGSASGLLEWMSVTGGSWRIFVASPGWASLNATGYDSLIFSLNGPVSVAGSALPRLALENTANISTPLIDLAPYISEVDADTTTWQRVAIPLTAFEPYGAFSLGGLKDFNFAQGTGDSARHTLWFDNVRVIARAAPPDTLIPSAPRSPLARVGDRSVLLHWEWNPEADLLGYNVYREEGSSGSFTLLNASPQTLSGYADLMTVNGTRYRYVIKALDAQFNESPPSDTVEAVPAAFASDNEFLAYVKQAAVDYFWYEANPANGLIRDRSTKGSVASIAAVGFGLTALTIGAENGWIERAAARDRTLTTLRTFWEGPQGTAASGMIGHKGWFYHWLDMESATRTWDSELSSIDTGLLLAGILHAREYYGLADPEEAEIRALADSIYARIDWPWMRNGLNSLTMGWRPESGFLPSRWIGYNEAMILYILGLGAPSNPLAPVSWSSWTSGYSWQTHYGYSFVAFPPLFGHQYSHCWIDFGGIADAYMVGRGITYAENTRRAAYAQQAYCIANPGGFTGYGPLLWGLTACDGPGGSGYQGYSARGAPPAQNDDGTIAPTAVAGSLPFAPDICVPTLRNMYDQYRSSIWCLYGFRDAFNLKAGWWDPDVIGIDQGPVALMLENHTGGGIWSRFMEAPEVQRGLEQAGFTPVNSVNGNAPGLAAEMRLYPNYPNPFNPSTTIRFALPARMRATLTVRDMIGRDVITLVDDEMDAGVHSVVFDADRFSSGVYFASLRSGGRTLVHKLLLLK